MFRRVRVIGRGRVGKAFAARLDERGVLADDNPQLIVLAVPDSVIPEVARRQAAGPWIAHVSGATPLAALDPHVRRFSLHPLQTFTVSRGPEQIDGAWAAATGETVEAVQAAEWLAGVLGLRAFPLADARRAMYHAGASIASNFLVTIYRAAARAVQAADVPAEALVPLMTRTIENGFDLTGPIARGDWVTVDAHLEALSRELPDLVPLYRSLAEATRR
jgi:predicted short-subunit dehydrogenase-like oxidoreductase (DUF2520 family)